MKMPAEEREAFWDKTWEEQGQLIPQQILYSRFSQAAYRNFKYFINEEDKLILETGCGTGRLCCLLAKDFPGAEIIGIDSSLRSLEIANRLKEYVNVSNVSFERGDLFAMPYPDNHFDVVFSDGVIEHFPLDAALNYKDALGEMVRVAKQKGKVIVDVPNWFCLVHTFYKWILKKLGREYEYGYEKSFKRKELITLFDEYKLTNIATRGYDCAHGIYRLNRYSRIFSWLGELAYVFDNQYLGNLFGYMVLIKGEKL